MLIECRFENHRSIRDEQAITFEASRLGETSDHRVRRIDGHPEPLLTAAVVYGANASGKSNVLSALAFMQHAVVASQRAWEPEGGIPRSAFAWANKTDDSSMFEVTFAIDGVKYAYGFVIDADVVEEEWLFAWPNNRKQIWFEREAAEFKFGENLKGPNQSVTEVTRPNSLFLSAAAQHGHAQLTHIYSWFRRIFPVNVTVTGSRITYTSFPGINSLFHLNEDQPSLFPGDEQEGSTVNRFRQLLKAADTGIVDVKRVDMEAEVSGRAFRRTRIMLQHQADDDESWLDLQDESEGTKTLFRIAPSLFRALDTGGILLVDELEASLHPLLGLAIVKLFNCPRANNRNAQLMFTTHDTNLLGTILGAPPLRRDQIWFTEKDKTGATTLYPLTDYKPRKAENLERGYLQGRYGAIPFLGDIAWLTG